MAESRRRRSWRGPLGAALVVVAALSAAVVATGRWDLVVATWTHRVGEPGRTWDVVALPEGSQPWLRVALVGDVGDGGDRAHETAAAIAAQSQVDRYDILMLLGDNVYPAGDPERIQATVFDPFGRLLENALASSEATWKLVGLHHPPYSSGFNGSREDLRDTFVPLFDEVVIPAPPEPRW